MDKGQNQGYETEDGVGVVYDARLRSDKINCKLLVALVTTLIALVGFIGFASGFWYGEKNIIDTGLGGYPQPPPAYVAPYASPYVSPQVNIPDIPVPPIANKHVWVPRIDRPFVDGIFPPPQGVFGAGNGDGPALNEEERNRLKEAAKKCKGKKCCREDDDVDTDSSECTSYDFLACLDAANACVWDCSEGRRPEERMKYNRKFKGIDRHKGKRNDHPQALKDEEDKNIDTVDPDLIVDVAGECDEMYQFRLNKKAREDEKKAVKNNRKKKEEEDGGDPKEEHRRLGGYNFTVTESGEMNETLRRKLGVIGGDGRVGVTSWQWPYYKNVYLTFNTNSGGMRCSGALISPRHVLTAGHCVSDGARSFYWNWQVKANFGAGYSKTFSVYQAWVLNGWHYNSDYNWDIAILTLHGSNTGFGWFGFGWNTGINGGWNFDVDGYPSDKGRTMQRQIMQMDQGIHENLLLTKTGDVVGGNSGGPVWYTGNKIIYGVVSHETYYTTTPPTYIHNGFARITKTKFDAMCSYIARFPETSYYTQYIS